MNYIDELLIIFSTHRKDGGQEWCFMLSNEVHEQKTTWLSDLNRGFKLSRIEFVNCCHSINEAISGDAFSIAETMLQRR